MRRLAVKQPGPRTTVEDLGRRDVARYGVPPGGAFDPLGLRAANRLVGNSDGAAGLELTLMGPTLENTGDEPIVAALVGTAIEAALVRGDTRATVAAHRPFVVPAGGTLRLAAPLRAARAWLALSGGIEVRDVLGSRSTYVPGGFGGFQGRALRAGDEIMVGPPGAAAPERAWEDPTTNTRSDVHLGLLAGPQEAEFGPAVLEALCATPWQAQPTSDRTGVRLAPPDGETAPPFGAPPGIPPEGTTLGAVQVPPDGCPILLGPDRPITGGYAKPAIVVRAHLGRLARLRPGEVVRFERFTLDQAVALDERRIASLPRLRGDETSDG